MTKCGDSLSGREASILALIAQAISVSDSERQLILDALDGRALLIAKEMLGDNCAQESIAAAAKGIRQWAESLKGQVKSG